MSQRRVFSTMTAPLLRWARWLHTGWPAGRVEALPEVGVDGQTAWPAVRVVGELQGVPLLKLALDSGARAVEAILREPSFAARQRVAGLHDLVILGAGPAGLAAAAAAKQAGLDFVILDAARPLSTLTEFPAQKPIYTYPLDLVPAGTIDVHATVKEALLEELEAARQRLGVVVRQARAVRLRRHGRDVEVELEPQPNVDSTPLRAHRVIVAIGRTGSPRRLGVPGEDLPHVTSRLFDPRDHASRRVVVVGGGDSAVESALALGEAGARVALVHRGRALVRPKPALLERLTGLVAAGRVVLHLGAQVEAITEQFVKVLDDRGEPTKLPADLVLLQLGRAAPLDFFERSGLPIRGRWGAGKIASLAAFFSLCCFVYLWKAGGAVTQAFTRHRWFPFNLDGFAADAIGQTLAGTLRQPGFYYSLVYTVVVLGFGLRRIRRTPTPYVRRQTLTLATIQLVPLFLLPYFVLPYLGHLGVFDGGAGAYLADHLFPRCDYDHGREYWRAFGFVLAWPLFLWNFFSPSPLGWWLGIGLVQTFVVLPLLVYRYGKGAYCGWICSCGALAETLGDAHRDKMPHGPLWNRLNLVGQAILAWAAALFVARIWSWYDRSSWLGAGLGRFYDRLLSNNVVLGVSLDYYHVVDLFLAGMVGVGLYFWFSGRVWCRFACPLAALMHLYARASRFRIFADKPKCISCNVCTTACHQGIDVMGFAQRGQPMEDPECVRCSACVASCPTGVLSFGALDEQGRPRLDRLEARIPPDRRHHLPIVR